MGVAHGAQILVSGAARAAATATSTIEMLDVGEHRLRDIPELVRLFQVSGEGLVGEFSPPRSLNSIVTNLPTQASSFIGRRDEVAAVRRMLGEHRVVTLTGVGGTGRTRLAIEVAAAELSAYLRAPWVCVHNTHRIGGGRHPRSASRCGRSDRLAGGTSRCSGRVPDPKRNVGT